MNNFILLNFHLKLSRFNRFSLKCMTQSILFPTKKIKFGKHTSKLSCFTLQHCHSFQKFISYQYLKVSHLRNKSKCLKIQKWMDAAVQNSQVLNVFLFRFAYNHRYACSGFPKRNVCISFSFSIGQGDKEQWQYR